MNLRISPDREWQLWSAIYWEDTGYFPTRHWPEELLQDTKRLHFPKPLTQHSNTPAEVDLLY